MGSMGATWAAAVRLERDMCTYACLLDLCPCLVCQHWAMCHLFWVQIREHLRKHPNSPLALGALWSFDNPSYVWCGWLCSIGHDYFRLNLLLLSTHNCLVRAQPSRPSPQHHCAGFMMQIWTTSASWRRTGWGCHQPVETCTSALSTCMGL